MKRGRIKRILSPSRLDLEAPRTSPPRFYSASQSRKVPDSGVRSFAALLHVSLSSTRLARDLQKAKDFLPATGFLSSLYRRAMPREHTSVTSFAA